MPKRSFKYRIYPTKVQLERLNNALFLLRDFYNAALQERRDAWKLNRKHISVYDQAGQISDIRRLNTDYMSVQARTLEQTLRQLDKAFAAFFRRVKKGEKPGYPRFKSASRFNSIIYNQYGFRFEQNKLNLSLLGSFKIKLSRPVEGTIKQVAVKREDAKWFVTIACDGVPDRPLPATNKES
jgi:putative transposase